MMTTGLCFRKFGKAASAACLALLFAGGTVAADELPLVDGTQWTTSAPEVKKAYLIGLANAMQIDRAYQAESSRASADDFSLIAAKGMQGQTLDAASVTLDKWYAANPDRLQRPVVETIWFEMVVPGLKKNK